MWGILGPLHLFSEKIVDALLTKLPLWTGVLACRFSEVMNQKAKTALAKSPYRNASKELTRLNWHTSTLVKSKIPQPLLIGESLLFYIYANYIH